jgi:PBP1b-binding outer membrane lipoprotein LpoB
VLGIYYKQRALLMKKFVLAAAIASTLFLAGCSDKVDESTITNVVQTSQYEQPNLGITAKTTPFAVKNLKITKVLLDTKTDYKAEVSYDLVANKSLDEFKSSMKALAAKPQTPAAKTTDTTADTAKDDMTSALHTLKNNLAAEVMVVAFSAKYGDFKAGQTVDTVNETVSMKKVNDQWVKD